MQGYCHKYHIYGTFGDNLNDIHWHYTLKYYAVDVVVVVLPQAPDNDPQKR